MGLGSRRSLLFVEPGRVEVREEPCPQPGPGEVLVRTLVSAISPGTELLFYRGQVPAGLAVDSSIAALAGDVAYPLKYGYACVGRVSVVGPGVPADWAGRLVFAFNPHESHFVAPLAALQPVPAGLDAEIAALLPNAETAVNLVMDGAPLAGERVVVFGQGVVGLLTAGLLASFPLERLLVIDPIAARRAEGLRLGAHQAFDPTNDTDRQALADSLAGRHGISGADLAFELSGQPAALNQAIDVLGFGGRIVAGSWYGSKTAALDLGGKFHRNRITLISSQVSTIAPGLQGRWNKTRRLETAWRYLAAALLRPLITQRFPVEQAAAAYALIDSRPEETIQVLLTYA